MISVHYFVLRLPHKPGSGDTTHYIEDCFDYLPPVAHFTNMV